VIAVADCIPELLPVPELPVSEELLEQAAAPPTTPTVPTATDPAMTARLLTTGSSYA
jgi:hypothetical protein